MEEKCIASILLGCVGDAIVKMTSLTQGYRGGRWEICYSGRKIYEELMEITNGKGLTELEVNSVKFMLSDDSITTIANGEGILNCEFPYNPKELVKSTSKELIKTLEDFKYRAAGRSLMYYLYQLRNDPENIYHAKFDKGSGGCGAAMRSPILGLVNLPIPELIHLIIDNARLTHHHPTGYLGSVACALFTRWAFTNEFEINEYPIEMLKIIQNDVTNFIKESNRDVELNLNSFNYFIEKWNYYLDLPIVEEDEPWDFEERDIFYKSISYSGNGGASGHDISIIAYDAFKRTQINGPNWESLVHFACMHQGDCDGTGLIALSMYGAMFGFQNVPLKNYENLEYRKRIEKIGKGIFYKYWNIITIRNSIWI